MLAEALKNVYHRRYDPRTEIDAQLFAEISRAINEATDTGFSGSDAGGDVMQQMRTN